MDSYHGMSCSERWKLLVKELRVYESCEKRERALSSARMSALSSCAMVYGVLLDW